MSPNLPRHAMDSAAVVAVFAAVVGIGLLAAAAGLFPRDGVPVDRPAIVERGCSGHTTVSTRCAPPTIASKHSSGSATK
jgi:hypothetical protein